MHRLILTLIFVSAGFCALSQSKKIIVSADGSGDFKTVQAAINSIKSPNKKPVTILVKNGIYKEKILIDSAKDFITLEGEDKFKTILTYDDHTGKIAPDGSIISTRTSWSFKVRADNFTAKNISFQNDAGFAAGQAVAVECRGDKAIFDNCRILGYQDILLADGDKNRQYFIQCYLEGTTDFIFGSATAWFQQCHIHSKKDSHITAASTPQQKPYGYIFNDCILTGDTSLRNVTLGRPWRPHAAVVFMHCYIGGHIKPDGWSNWNKTENYKTARYAEYKNYGPSADSSLRVGWSKQLTDDEVKLYTLQNVFGTWNPSK